MHLAIILAVTTLAYCWLLYHFRYWKRRGIPQLQPSIPFGNIGPVIRQRLSVAELLADLYQRSKQWPCAGVYFSFRPALIVNDPQLIKDILARDFDHFDGRGMHVDEKRDPLSSHLVSLAGDEWRDLRGVLDSAFTGSRVRAMFPMLTKVGRTLQEFIGKCVVEGGVVEVREVMGRYTTDVIASVGFGLEVDSINDGKSMFRQLGLLVFATGLKNSLRIACTFFAPGLKDFLGFKCVAPEVEQFLRKVVQETIEYRENSKVSRRDLMQLLLQFRNSGTMSSDDKWELTNTNGVKSMTLEQVMANTFSFFIAAYEASSATLSFCLYELSKNATIQRKVQREIDSMLSGELTVDNLANMRYLDACINETYRMYPPLPFLNRKCCKEYRLAGTGAIVPRGTPVIISLFGLNRDATYYPDPDEFKPERFDNEHTEGRSVPFYPFGYGPRICIGKRMGQLKTKVALVMLLSKFDVRLAEAGKELKFDPKCFTLFAKGGVPLVFSERVR